MVEFNELGNRFLDFLKKNKLLAIIIVFMIILLTILSCGAVLVVLLVVLYKKDKKIGELEGNITELENKNVNIIKETEIMMKNYGEMLSGLNKINFENIKNIKEKDDKIHEYNAKLHDHENVVYFHMKYNMNAVYNIYLQYVTGVVKKPPTYLESSYNIGTISTIINDFKTMFEILIKYKPYTDLKIDNLNKIKNPYYIDNKQIKVDQNIVQNNKSIMEELKNDINKRTPSILESII